ncbi:MAG: DNA topoisomerase [Myxococcota bacterium]
MGKRLVIAEKPSVALDMANALGPYDVGKDKEWYETSDFVITYAVGHLLELVAPEVYNEKWKNWSLKQLPMLPEAFKYTPRDKKAATRLKVIKKLAHRKDVSGIINGCDAGREGEHIFRTILGQLDSELPTQRLWLSSMTERAIIKGFQELKDSKGYDSLAAAAASRSEADWLIGMNATRALTRRLKSFSYEGAWSAGRVQTPTLAMCVDRELEVLHHVPRTYWEFMGHFEADDHAYEAKYRADANSDVDSEHSTRIFDRARMEAVQAGLAKAKTGKASEKRTRRQEKPPLPYDLTSLQRQTGMTAKRTQDVAQALYERHKLLSYPRTDSRYLPEDQRAQLSTVLSMVGGLPVLKPVVERIQADGPMNLDRVFDDKRVTDHHAIVPVGIPMAGQLDDTERRVYDIVTRQFLASLMPPAHWEHVTRTTTVVSDGEHHFRSVGKRLVEPGWQFAMGKDVGAGSPLQALNPAENATVLLSSVDTIESETKPPGRLTDASLLRKMETCGKDLEDADFSAAMGTRGLGTPATRADTIERLIRRGYLAREGRSLRATAKAIRLVDVLQRAGAIRLTSADLTGDMEHKLAQVEDGALERGQYMRLISENTADLTDLLVQFDFDTLYGPEKSVGNLEGNAKQSVWETAWGYASEAEEPFFIWKDVQGHVLLPEEMRRMLEAEDGRIGPVTLYPARGGSRGGYQAKLRLRRRTEEEYAKQLAKKTARAPSRWIVEVESLDGSRQRVDEDEEKIGPFLVTPAGWQIIETTGRWADAEHLDGERPKAVLPKLVCERPMTPQEAEQFFMEGKTDLLGSFISRRGKPFRARLILKANGRHGFEFEPRKPRAPRGAPKADGDAKAEAKAAPKGKAAKSKAKSPKSKAKSPKSKAKKASSSSAKPS